MAKFSDSATTRSTLMSGKPQNRALCRSHCNTTVGKSVRVQRVVSHRISAERSLTVVTDRAFRGLMGLRRFAFRGLETSRPATRKMTPSTRPLI